MKQKLQQLVRTKIWRMDIHPSARISASALIDRTWPKGVHIGENTILCEEVILLTHDITRGIFTDTWIGADCFLLARSIILPGVHIGDACIIMPGAVIAKDVPANSIATGNPATIKVRQS